ncbi:hypothetical protein Tco_0712687 [Tanacetum coccineum]
MKLSRRTNDERIDTIKIISQDIKVAGKTCGEVGGDGLVASNARWRGKGCDKELVVMGEVGGVLLGGGDGGDVLEEDMRIMKRSEEFRREEVIECEEDE